MKTSVRFAVLFSLTTLLFVPALSQIIIASQPETVAAVGRLYTYQVQVQDLSARAVRDMLKYSLATAPPGMTIDSAKGLLQWVPKSIGVFSVEIVVSSRLSRTVTQSYKLTIVGFFGTLAGIVRDTTGHGIPRIMVSLFSVKPPSIQPLVMPAWGALTAITDSAGRYTISPIDSGTYYAVAMSLCNVLMAAMPCPYDDYITVYYKDSPTLAGATPIPIKDSNAVRIDFLMHKRGKPANVTISGTARDTAGKPIAGASVIVSPINKCPVADAAAGSAFAEPVVSSPSIIVGYADAISLVKTDPLGNYKATVMAGGPYVVECLAQGYVIQFYKLKSNFLEADRLTLSKDSSGVDFRMVPPPKATAKVSGVVHDSSGKGVQSNVVLYSRGPQPMASVFLPVSARTVRTDTLGNFVFENVPNGAYILQAIPLRGYLPAYYSRNGCGETQWKKADTIFVKGSDISGVVVCVRKANVRGAGSLTGHIFMSDGSTLDGVVIVAESRSDPSIITYAVSDASGNYELLNLDPGAYDISLDKVGYVGPDGVMSNVVYGQNTPTTDLRMTLEGIMTSAPPAGTGLPESYALFQNYPNPFNPSTIIRYDLQTAAMVTLRIFNTLGQEVETLVNGLQSASSYSMQWNASNVPSGIYFYRLQVHQISGRRAGDAATGSARGFVETRRMILLK